MSFCIRCAGTKSFITTEPLPADPYQHKFILRNLSLFMAWKQALGFTLASELYEPDSVYCAAIMPNPHISQGLGASSTGVCCISSRCGWNAQWLLIAHPLSPLACQ